MQNQTQNNWQVKRLDEVATVTMGQSPASSSYNSQGTGVPFLQGMPSVVDGMGTVVPQQWTTEPTKVVEAGTALMTVRAPVGELFTTNNFICLGRGLAGIKANNEVSQTYLNYYLQFSKSQLNTFSQGSTFTAINSDSLKGIQVVLPSSTQQEYIGNVLIAFDEAIQKTDQIIQKTELLKQELTKTLLTNGIEHKEFKKTKVGVMPENWNIVSLKEVSKIASGQVDPKNEPYASMILLAPNHIESGSGRILEREKAKDQQAISGKYLVEKGDVIYSKIRPYLKKVTIADGACLCSADMYPMKGLNNLNNNFLFHVLLSEHFTNYANSNSGRTGIPKLNREELGHYTFALPPIKEQIEISSILSSMDEKILINQEIKKKYVLIKNGLMNDIFNQKVQIN